MKPLLIFSGNLHHCVGGMGDYQGSVDTVDEAIEFAKRRDFSWIEIVDHKTMQVVFSGNPRARNLANAVG